MLLKFSIKLKLALHPAANAALLHQLQRTQERLRHRERLRRIRPLQPKRAGDSAHSFAAMISRRSGETGFSITPMLHETWSSYTAAVEPFINQSLSIPCIVPEALGMADHTVVIPHAFQLALERGDDLGKRKISRWVEPLLELAASPARNFFAWVVRLTCQYLGLCRLILQ